MDFGRGLSIGDGGLNSHKKILKGPNTFVCICVSFYIQSRCKYRETLHETVNNGVTPVQKYSYINQDSVQ